MQKTSRSVVPFIEEETPHVVMTKSHVAPKGGGGTPSPSPFGDPRDPHDPRDPRKGDYKSARAATLHLSQLICCCVELWWCMVIFQNGGPQNARGGGGLGDLGNPMNVHGLQNMSVGYPEERTRLDGHPIQPTKPRNMDLKYLRSFWRVHLTHNVVNGIINSYCHIMHNEENCFLHWSMAKTSNAANFEQSSFWNASTQTLWTVWMRAGSLWKWVCLRCWTISFQTTSRRFIRVLAGRGSPTAINTSNNSKSGWTNCK